MQLIAATNLKGDDISGGVRLQQTGQRIQRTDRRAVDRQDLVAGFHSCLVGWSTWPDRQDNHAAFGGIVGDKPYVAWCGGRSGRARFWRRFGLRKRFGYGIAHSFK